MQSKVYIRQLSELTTLSGVSKDSVGAVRAHPALLLNYHGWPTSHCGLLSLWLSTAPFFSRWFLQGRCQNSLAPLLLFWTQVNHQQNSVSKHTFIIAQPKSRKVINKWSPHNVKQLLHTFEKKINTSCWVNPLIVGSAFCHDDFLTARQSALPTAKELIEYFLKQCFDVMLH